MKFNHFPLHHPSIGEEVLVRAYINSEVDEVSYYICMYDYITDKRLGFIIIDSHGELLHNENIIGWMPLSALEVLEVE